MESISRVSSSEKGLCFWVSRYDCFGDEEEYKIGIETIKVLLLKVENRLQPDRRVASSFIGIAYKRSSNNNIQSYSDLIYTSWKLQKSSGSCCWYECSKQPKKYEE